MKAINPNEVAEKIREYNPWQPKQAGPKVSNQETVEHFLLNGGEIYTHPAIKIDLIKKSKSCCTATFQDLM